MASCGRLEIGLPKLSRNQQQADSQSAQVTNLPHINQTNCGEAVLCYFVEALISARRKQPFS